MKTSTKIILFLAVLSLAAPLTLFIFSYVHQKELKSGYVWITKAVPPFSVVVGMGKTTFSIEGCDSNVVASHLKNGHVTYLYVRNDTLFVQETNIKNEAEELIVVRSKSLRSIVVSPGDMISVSKLKEGPLSLHCTGGFINIEGNLIDALRVYDTMKKEPTVTSFLEIVASNSSEIHLNKMKLKSWSVRLNESSMEANTIISDELKLTAKNHSLAKINLCPHKVFAERDSISDIVLK
jgi:hypothetical protein